MQFLFPLVLLAVFVAILYASISHRPTRRQLIAWVLLLAASISLYGAGAIVLAEYRFSRDGRVSHGVVIEKPAPATYEVLQRHHRRRAGQGLPSFLILFCYEIPDLIARLISTGSPSAWVVEYRYDCGGAMCRGSDLVSDWQRSGLYSGAAVSVRLSGTDAPRLSSNPARPMAIAKAGVAAMLLLGAGFISGRFSRRLPYVTAPAVVTAVDAVNSGPGGRWRITFAYFAPDGRALESADEVYVEGVKPGDDCVAVYPPKRPDLGTLRLLPRT